MVSFSLRTVTTICLATFLFLPYDGVESRVLTMKKFDLGTYPLGVCNDGTPAGYYFSPSPNNGNDWLLFLEGGGMCFDKDSCLARPSSLTSSKGWTATVNGGGIFNSSTPELGNMNLVYAPYCSSDAWTGSISANNIPFGFNFRGRDILDAIIGDLVTTHGLGSQSVTNFMFSGCSAGARGALFNLDRLHGVITSTIPNSKNLAYYGGLLDSAFWMDIQPANASVIPFGTQIQDIYALANSSYALSESCLSQFPTDQQWKCMMGEYAVPYLSYPYLLYAFQYDEFQLTSDFGNPSVPNKTPAQLAYDEYFRNITRFSAYKDTITPAKTGTAALLPACFKHCNTQDYHFQTLATNGVTLEQATVNWFWNRQCKDSTIPSYIVEDCVGFNCGTNCPQV